MATYMTYIYLICTYITLICDIYAFCVWAGPGFRWQGPGQGQGLESQRQGPGPGLKFCP